MPVWLVIQVPPPPLLPPFKSLHLTLSISFVFMAGVCLSPSFPCLPLICIVFSIGQSELDADTQRTIHKITIYFSRSEWSQYRFSLSHWQSLNYSILQRFVNLQHFDNVKTHVNKNYVNIKLSSICYHYLNSRRRKLFTENASIGKAKNQAMITRSSTNKRAFNDTEAVFCCE